MPLQLQLMTMAFTTMTKNMIDGLCDESIYTIVMVVVNALYNYKYSHTCNYIFYILA